MDRDWQRLTLETTGYADREMWGDHVVSSQYDSAEWH
jgi:hypothetical protein